MNSNKRIIIYKCPKCLKTISFSLDELDIGTGQFKTSVSPNRFMSLPKLFCMDCCIPSVITILEYNYTTKFETTILYSEVESHEGLRGF